MSVKKILLSLFISCLSVIAFAEDFYVIKVTGSITVNGKSIKAGDKISTGQKIKFETNESNAVVISTKRGQMVLAKDAKQSKSELELTLAALVNPPKGQLSTRSGGINNIIDLKNHFSKEKYLILDSISVEINKSAFELSDSKFFYIRYTYNGEEINKKLEFEPSSNKNTNRLKINNNTLLSVDDQPIAYSDISDSKLYYYDSDKEESTFITDLDLVCPNSSVLRYEIQIISNTYQGKKDAEVKKEIKSYLSQEYGSLNNENFETWYKTLE